ncbi:extracellular solute-binding protein [Paenibacillus sp. LMG 31458]|uniref:Extracellular solute-binding protein n=1 Tax=Paenibacillus phytorum TaxID=2654977 RepID=A0ABX1Y541_9BACL|nr:extracellular solute-binding protein [Paenibacillus phytorum]NOU76018.1 extracellular solute-binding protein [Paenibacillus phytorum]
MNNNRKFKTVLYLSMVVAILGGSAIGCSKNDTASSTQPSSTAKVDTGKHIKISSMFPLYGNPAQKTEAWKFIEDKFNIDYEPLAIPNNSSEEKEKLAVASGDMADFMVWESFPSADFYNYTQQGAFLALDEYIKNSPNIMKLPKSVWDNVKINGKIYGVPRPRPLTTTAIMIRKDWLDNLGLPVPKTTDDLFKTAVAFTKNDPDKNGKADTFGFAVGENLAFLETVWHAFDTGNGWRVMEDGTLMNSASTPGRKQALTFIRDLYKEGAIDKDFAVLKTTQVWDKINNGNAGIYIGNISDYAHFVADTTKINPNAKFEMIPLVTGPTGKSGVNEQIGFYGLQAIPAKLEKDPEKVKRIISFLDWQMSDEGAVFKEYGLEGVHYTKNADGTLKANTDKLKADAVGNLISQNKFDPYLLVAKTAEPEVQKKQHDMFDYDVDKGVKNPVINYLAPTQIEKGADLNKLRDEFLVSVVMGKRPIEDFDKFANEWLDKGGRQLTKEVNDWYKANKK